MTRVCKQIIEKRDSFWYDWKGSMIINEIKDRYVLGRNYAYKSIFIPKSEFLNQNLSYKLGKSITIQIIGRYRNSLEGKLV